MGLLDSIVSQVGGELGQKVGSAIGGAMGGGQAAGGQAGGMDLNTIISLGTTLLNSQGGVAGLVQKFQAGGMGDVVNSWVGTGANSPISADQIKNVLGNGQLSQLAGSAGLDVNNLAGMLSQHLPGIIDKLTPNGQVQAQPAGGLDLGSLIGGFLK